MDKKAFIERIAPLAQADMRMSGILASVTIAQACLESAYGTSELAVNANNLFGMKTVLSGNTWTSVWDGVSKYCKETKEQDASGKEYTITADFRAYPKYLNSVSDHSLYLMQAKKGDQLRYAGLTEAVNYRKAIQIIKNGGYATDVKYVDRICAIIETYNLTQYDGGKKMKICLDAGHFGKYNQSPCNPAYYESDMVWKLHKLQKKYLEAYGVEVITTRDDQGSNPALYDRGAMSAGCDLFISDHSNAAAKSTVDYPVAYCAIDGSADGIGMALAQCVETIMGTKQSARIDHLKNSRGTDYYGVIRGATAVGTPGMILEHSFHTNPEMTSWLMDNDNLDRLAKAEADTMAMYYGLSAPKHITGWVEEDGGWRYYLDTNGKRVENAWYQDGDKWYWFDGAGLMVINVWYFYNGAWYYLGADGAMVKGQVTVDDKWYVMDSEGRMITEPVTLTPDQDGALQYSGLA